jgi:hypothetical protein
VRARAGRSKITALALLGLGVAFYLIFALGETAGDDISGLQHLLPAAILALLLWVGWTHPRQAGISLLASPPRSPSHISHSSLSASFRSPGRS